VQEAMFKLFLLSGLGRMQAGQGAAPLFPPTWWPERMVREASPMADADGLKKNRELNAGR
jgi:hypothetical protein